MEEIKIELFIPGEFKEKPIICDMVKNFNISMKIIEASFSTESGWAYLILTAEKDEIKKVFDFLKNEGANVEIREQRNLE
ncbi:MAG: NIL domain-containing protein [Candidatus Omnitrophota bacterium]